MNPNELEKRIQEQRTIEANKKRLVGASGKLGVILKNLGYEIEGQTAGGLTTEDGFGYSSNKIDFGNATEHYADATNALDFLKRIPVIGAFWGSKSEEFTEKENEEEFYDTYSLGWGFDALKYGVHLEIQYRKDERRLEVYYKGFRVYQEVMNELTSYIPHKEWESKIDYFYEMAKKKQTEKKKEVTKENQVATEKDKKRWWQEIKDKWGG